MSPLCHDVALSYTLPKFFYILKIILANGILWKKSLKFFKEFFFALTAQIFYKKNFYEVYLIYNVLISGIQQSNSVIYVCILFHIHFHYGLLQDNEYSFLCYTVSYCLSILYILIVLCLCLSQTPNLSFPHFPLW